MLFAAVARGGLTDTSNAFVIRDSSENGCRDYRFDDGGRRLIRGSNSGRSGIWGSSHFAIERLCA
jgi:hypothetical protein